MDRDTKEKIFIENYDLVLKVYNSKYKSVEFDSNHKEDIVQEGLVGLWLGIDKGKLFDDKGNLDKGKAFNYIWSYQGAYVRRKILLDPRVEQNKDITFESLYFIKDGNEINKMDLEGFNYKSAEDIAIEKYRYKNFFDFFRNVDEYCNLNYRFYDIIMCKLNGLNQTEISKVVGINQSMISKRIKQMYSLYKDTIA